MRFTSLDLIAYGHFDRHHIDLSQGRFGLHLIYGPNEAGKSTTLRAITSLLYGFDNITPDNFQHQNRDLRIGASLLDHDGNELKCVRRKGRIGTLYDGDDADVIDEGHLQRMLRGIDKNAFVDRFGISHAALVEGGRMMVKGNGDVGQSLFAAGAGLSQLKQVLDQIESESDGLFKKSRNKAELNLLLSDLREKRRELKEKILPSTEFSQLEALRNEKGAQAELFRNALKEAATSVKRLERLRDGIPLRGQWVSIEQQLHTFEDVPNLSTEFEARFRQASSKSAACRTKIESIEARIAKAQKTLADLGQPNLLLDHAETIESLVQDVGGINKSIRDRPGLIKRRDLTRGQIVERLKSMERGDAESVWDIQLPQELRMKIRHLVGQYEALAQSAEGSSKALENLKLQASQVEAKLDKHPAPPACDTLVTVLQQVGDASAQVHDLEAAKDLLVREEQNVQTQVRRCVGLQCDASQAVKLIVPGRETVQQFADRFEAASQRMRQLVEKQDECQRGLQQRGIELDALRQSGDVPSEAELLAARRERDALGIAFRQGSGSASSEAERHASPGVSPESRRSAAGVGNHEAFFSAITRCDELSDRLRREADRVLQRHAWKPSKTQPNGC
ncbi:MAG: AAA family ATPase [Pirellulaceae bacterium]